MPKKGKPYIFVPSLVLYFSAIFYSAFRQDATIPTRTIVSQREIERREVNGEFVPSHRVVEYKVGRYTRSVIISRDDFPSYDLNHNGQVDLDELNDILKVR